MKIITLMIALCISMQCFAQLEKAGIFASTAITTQKYSTSNVKNSSRNDFFTMRYRIGGMLSRYGDHRFSFESGIMIDQYNINQRRELSFLYDDEYYLRIKRHIIRNIGIPISVTMRTNTARNCVTYFKLSLINLFTVNETQDAVFRDQASESSNQRNSIEFSSFTPRYYSTDIDFGFGTFWYIKRYGLKLALEPKITILQYRGQMEALSDRSRVIVNAGSRLLPAMGFEVTLYKDIF